MVKYELRVHVRDVIFGLDVGNHTGYDLITIHEDGSKTIQYIDLYTNASLDIGFYISAPVPAQEYTITDEDGNSRTILWGTQTAHDGAMQATTVEYLTEYKVYTSTIIEETDSAEALKAFNKIKLEATFLQSLKNELVYNPQSRNCNTSTNYFAQQYLNGQNVFAELPYGIYMGYSDPFYDPNSTSTTDVTIKAVRNIIDKYYSLVGTDVDLSNVNYGVVNQSDAWYAKFTTDDYNYVFAGNGEANIVDIYGDSFIYAETGNHTINAGSGNDRIYGREANVIDGGEGKDVIYAGDQTYATHSINGGSGDDHIYAGHGGDDVRGGSGNNTVYLGSGSDKYTGGDDVDIVDGGSQDFIFTDTIDKSFKYNLSADLSGDINEINLGAGNDEYRGGIGKDIVHGGDDNDKIWGGDGNNELYGDAGNDYIYGGKDNDTINGGTGKDVMSPGTGINTIDCGQDNDMDIVAINNNFAGIDTIKNASPHDYISCNGGFNLETLQQIDNDVIIFGNNGNKIIFKDVKVDDSIPDENMPTLYQPDGTLLYWHNGQYQESTTHFPPYLEEPEDIDYEAFLANAGSGSQNIVTGTNNYIILEESQTFTNAISSTTVMNASGEQVWFTSNATNSRYIGCNANEDITINRNNNNVFTKGGIDQISVTSSSNHIDAGSGDDTISIGNYRFYGNNNTVNGGTGNDTINVNGSDNTIDGGADSDTITISSGTNNLIIGGTGNDTINISTQNNIVEWKSGDGYDTVSAKNNNNLIRIKDMRLQDVLIQNNGTYGSFRIVSKNDDGQGVNFGSIKYYEIEGTQYNVENGLTLTQTDMDETIYGTNANDTIIGNKGNDTIYGGGGINTYIWNIGDGRDTIDGSGGTNHIKFGSGIKFEDLQIDYTGGNHGYDAFIYIKGNKEEGILYRDFLDPQRNIASLIFEDGTIVTNAGATYSPELYGSSSSSYISGSVWNDTMLGDDEDNSLSGGDGDDILIGGKGNDTLIGGEGNNTYIWNIGDGRDEISIGNPTSENRYGAIGISTIEFGEGISFENLNFRGQYNKLFIYVGNNDAEGVVLDEYRDEEHPVFLKFKDGSTINLSAIGLTFHQTDEDNYLTGSLKDDIIHLGNNGGTAYGSFGNNTIYGGDGDDTIDGAADYFNEGDIHGNNLLYGGKGNDFINGGNGKDYLEGGEGNDILYGEENDDILYGGTGDDSLFGGEGDDTYIYKLGDGNDYIDDEGGNDKIVFGEGITLDDLSFSRDRWSQYRSNVYIDISKTNSRIEICGQIYENTAIETLEFADGSQVSLTDITAQLTQAMNSFGADTSSTADTLSNPTQDVSDMYSLAASQDLIKKAI